MTRLASFTVQTARRDQWINISAEVEGIVAASGVREGICVVFIPHTTAAVTVNENADPDVPADVILALEAAAPDRPGRLQRGEPGREAPESGMIMMRSRGAA